MREIQLSQGKVALVDDEDYELVSGHNWYADKGRNTWYASATIDGKRVRMHTLVSGFKLVDHENRNGLDNRRSNLRACMQGQNLANGVPRGGTSRFRGVCWSKQAGCWMAQAIGGKRHKFLGHYDSEVDAAKAYDRAALREWGEFASLNFPELRAEYESAPERPRLRRPFRPAKRPIVGASRYRGVQWNSQKGKWRVVIKVEKRSRHLGFFVSEEEAAKAYDRAAVQAWGEHAQLNFPRPPQCEDRL
jgi:hypothetical protein